MLKNVTAYRVSKETGIPANTFTDWKNGRSKPKFDKLLILAKYFNVPVEYFAEEDLAPSKGAKQLNEKDRR